MNLSILLISFILSIVVCSPVYADPNDDIDENASNIVKNMLIDLGGHTDNNKNNGKKIKCSNGGSKKISIVKNGNETTYTGEYLYCRENNTTRDGIFKISAMGDIILSSESRRSINGELFDAARIGDLIKVKKYIKAKADVNYTESITISDKTQIYDWSPLMMAVTSRNLDVVKQLVSAGAWVNYLNSQVFNAVKLAVDIDRMDMLKYLVEHGAYINNSNYEGVTPLMSAAINGNYDIVQYLVRLHADLNSRHNDGDSALMFAIARGQSKIANLLLDSGADVNIKNRFGVTALLIAVAEGNADILNKLIINKADLTVKSDTGKTALDIAVEKGHTAIIEQLKKAVRLGL
jgi:ankyrin repeat protein